MRAPFAHDFGSCPKSTSQRRAFSKRTRSIFLSFFVMRNHSESCHNQLCRHVKMTLYDGHETFLLILVSFSGLAKLLEWSLFRFLFTCSPFSMGFLEPSCKEGLYLYTLSWKISTSVIHFCEGIITRFALKYIKFKNMGSLKTLSLKLCESRFWNFISKNVSWKTKDSNLSYGQPLPAEHVFCCHKKL